MPKLEFDAEKPLEDWNWGEFDAFPKSGELFRELSESAGYVVINDIKEALAAATVWFNLSEDKKSLSLVIAAACGATDFNIECPLDDALEGALEDSDERKELATALREIADKLEK